MNLYVLLLSVLAFAGEGEFKKLAVVDFDTSTMTKNIETHFITEEEREAAERKVSNEMRSLAVALMTALERQLMASYDLVERRKLNTVLREQSLKEGRNMKDLQEDQERLAELLRQMVGADLILTGTITEFALERRNVSNHPYFKGRAAPQDFVRYQMSASFRLIDATDGRIFLVEDAVANTDSARLRRERKLGSAYRHALCKDMAQQIEESLRLGLIANGIE